ncbi:MAG TPA: hypothetical protein VF984_06065 [Actinomycetota bacterium]
MGPELTSTAPPTRLRLAGFLALTLGGGAVALGSLLDWATVRPFQTPTPGIDVWEGKVTFGLGMAVLVGMIVMRVLSTPRPRTSVAAAIIVLGLAATVLGGLDAARAQDRFSSPGQRDRIARELAGQLGLPYAQVRAQIEQQFDRRFSVGLEMGIWLVMAGGVVAAAGGALSVAWARTPRTEPAPPEATEQTAGSDPAAG